MRLRLLTLDEAREVVVHSAIRLLERCHTDEPFEVTAMLWGAGTLDRLDPADRALARRHRRVLDTVIELGYGAEIVDELDGVSSSAGLDEGRFQRWMS